MEIRPDLKTCAKIALLLLVAVLSVTKIAPWMADPANHRHSIEQTDEKIGAVMTLSGGAAATSATLSLLPGDLATPLAEQLAELATYFLLILSALYLEKFLITISAHIAFSFLIPFACILWCVSIIIKKKFLRTIALKIALMSMVIFLVVPASILLSDMVYQTQAQKINGTIEEYNELEIDGGSTDSDIIPDTGIISGNTIDRISSFLGNMLESLAVMIVTACVIPVLVFVFLAWMIKIIFIQGDKG